MNSAWACAAGVNCQDVFDFVHFGDQPAPLDDDAVRHLLGHRLARLEIEHSRGLMLATLDANACVELGVARLLSTHREHTALARVEGQRVLRTTELDPAAGPA